MLHFLEEGQWLLSPRQEMLASCPPAQTKNTVHESHLQNSRPG